MILQALSKILQISGLLLQNKLESKEEACITTNGVLFILWAEICFVWELPL